MSGGCGMSLGRDVRCDGVRLCHECFVARGPRVRHDAYEQPYEAWRPIYEALMEHAPRLRGLGHVHAHLDANARTYIAQLAVTALERAGFRLTRADDPAA